MLQYEVQPTIPSNYYTTIQHYKDDNHWEQQTMTTPRGTVLNIFSILPIPKPQLTTRNQA